MITRDVLMDWILEALRTLDGQGSVLDVSKQIWKRHEHDLRSAGDLFYTWQYDIRWAAKRLRDLGKLKPVNDQRGLPWTLASYTFSETI
jgi:hypothetical protein